MMLCPRCKRSRRTIQVGKKKKGKRWIITQCGTCGYNFTLEEWTTYDTDIAAKIKDWKRPAGGSDGKWFV